MPEVDFDVAPELVMLPQELQMFNKSRYGSIWAWDFGDGGVSEDKSPRYQYTSPGIYDIILRAWTEDGCFGEMIKHNAVRVEGEGIMKFPNAFRPDASGPSGGRYDSNAPNPNTIFYPFHSGVDEYRLEIFNRWGELLFVSEDIEIGWDGYYKGRLSKEDVYVWKVRGTFINGIKFIDAGDVTLLR
jgi:PKD repeat protein